MIQLGTYRGWLGVSICLALTALSVCAQSPSIGNLGGSGNSAGTTGTDVLTVPRRSGSNSGSLGGGSPYPGSMPRPIFISGRVTGEAGELDEPVMIDRVCGGNVRREGYTDRRGYFGLQLGQNTSFLADSTSGGFGPGMGQSGQVRERDLANCELRFSLAGYRPVEVNLGNHRSLDDSDVGTIILHSMSPDEGSTVSVTTMRAPKNASRALEKAVAAARKGKIDVAQKQLEKAVALYPNFALAWFQLGRLYERKNDPERARSAYRSSIAADPKFISPYENLYMLAARENKWAEVVELTDRVLTLDRYDFPEAYLYNGVANLNLRKHDAAEKVIRELLATEAGKRMPRAHYVLGVILGRKRDFAGSAEQLRWYLQAVPDAADAELARRQLALAESAAQAVAQAK